MGSVGWQGRVRQDGQTVAGVNAPDEASMLLHLRHYAAVYSQDGPVTIEVKRSKGRWKEIAL